ncbi:hypothetical protein ISS06_00995 [Patescibacteria group bacterium]|nr:hypothetical protein [Patescibacteria group bacterium]
MVIISAQLASWDSKTSKFNKIRGDDDIDPDWLEINDKIIVKHKSNTDLMTVIKIEESKDKNIKPAEYNGFILRKATEADMAKDNSKNKNKQSVIKQAQSMADKRKLSIRIVDILFSFDGSRIVFAFVSKSRVDFRKLVQDLSKKFFKSIRMHQVGARQEAQTEGDIGCCGRTLCCKGFLTKLGNVPMCAIADQQLSQRGTARMSGICGRLKCCLSYEQDAYKELMKNIPKIGTIVKTKAGKGKIIERRILKGTVIVEIDNKNGQNKRIEVLNEKI